MVYKYTIFTPASACAGKPRARNTNKRQGGMGSAYKYDADLWAKTLVSF